MVVVLRMIRRAVARRTAWPMEPARRAGTRLPAIGASRKPRAVERPWTGLEGLEPRLLLSGDPLQVVTGSASASSLAAGESLSLEAVYTTQNPEDETLTGLGLRLHFDSSELRFDGMSGVLEDDKVVENTSPQPDSNDADGDPATDQYVQVAWSDFSGQWPGDGQTPTTLYAAAFTANSSFSGTTLRFSASSTAAGRALSADPVTLTQRDTTPPSVSVDNLRTNDPTPALSGTVNDASATVQLSVDGQGPIEATNHGDGTWSLADDALAELTPGTHDVAVSATDPAGNVGTDGTTDELTVRTATVEARHLFYNGSAFDGSNPAPGPGDDAAIAPGVEALPPGASAGPGHVSNAVRGITGVMVDIQALADAAELSADDFAFRVGNSDDPSAWSSAPLPESLAVRSGAGVNGSDRVTLTWPDEAVAHTWLRVRVKANERTGLLEDEVFYFGNAPGDVGNSDTDLLVNATDELRIRSNPRSPLNPAPIDSPHDLNRDGLVDATDQLAARTRRTSPANALKLITAPGSGSANTVRSASAVHAPDSAGATGSEPSAAESGAGGTSPAPQRARTAAAAAIAGLSTGAGAGAGGVPSHGTSDALAAASPIRDVGMGEDRGGHSGGYSGGGSGGHSGGGGRAISVAERVWAAWVDRDAAHESSSQAFGEEEGGDGQPGGNDLIRVL